MENNLFKKMFNFSYERSVFEAISFYLFWCLVIFIVSIVLVSIVSLFVFIASKARLVELSDFNGKGIYGNIAHYVSALICFAVTFLIIFKKKIYNLVAILLFILAIFASLSHGYGEALSGFIFTSILTTFKNKEKTSVS